jgi:hypothetical protein
MERWSRTRGFVPDVLVVRSDRKRARAAIRVPSRNELGKAKQEHLIDGLDQARPAARKLDLDVAVGTELER